MNSKRISLGLVIFTVVILLSSSTIPGSALDDWKKGDEKNYTGGHTFEEEFWVADHQNKTNEGHNLTSSIFYMNNHNPAFTILTITSARPAIEMV